MFIAALSIIKVKKKKKRKETAEESNTESQITA